jgi:hypothetical protein
MCGMFEPLGFIGVIAAPLILQRPLGFARIQNPLGGASSLTRGLGSLPPKTIVRRQCLAFTRSTSSLPSKELVMNRMSLIAVAGTLALLCGEAFAQSKADRCAAYAREAARSTPTSTGVVRGAARGAVGGAIFGDAGRGAALGAAVGGTRRVAQRGRSYQSYYNECMRR